MRTNKAVSMALATVAMIAMVAPATVVNADELDDKKVQLEQQEQEREQALELVNSDLAKTERELQGYQNQLPGARQALSDAEGRVSAAQAEVQALANRVSLAEENKAKITDRIEKDKAAMVESKKSIGQIAAQAYKMGGVPSTFTLMFSGGESQNFTDSMNMVDQVLRSQGQAVSTLAEQNATNVNSEARLAAIEEEIKALKEKADQALAAEQQARDQAAQKKAELDGLVSKATALSDKLEAQKPKIQAQLNKIQDAQDANNAAIAERQRKLLEEAKRREEEARRQEEERRRQAEEEARRNQNNGGGGGGGGAPAPAPPPPAPAPGPGGGGAFNLINPVDAPLTSGFGWRPTPPGTRDWFGTGGYLHSGQDYGAGCGVPIRAAAGGEVWFSDYEVYPGSGNRIVLNNGVRGGTAMVQNYYHLTQRYVSQGQTVSQGQIIGTVGTTGNSTGCHLHFETMVNGTLVDPMPYLP